MIRADRTATEAWLARHATVACPMGARITPAQCARLRERPTFGDLAREGYWREHGGRPYTPADRLPRPIKCATCARREYAIMGGVEMEAAGIAPVGTATCRVCGAEFTPYLNGRSEIRDTCKPCMLAKRSASIRATVARKAALAAGIDKSESEAPAASITIDLGQWPDLAHELTRLAVEDLRTPEMQATWLLIHALRAAR